MQDDQDVENEETDFKICYLGKIFWATDKLQQI